MESKSFLQSTPKLFFQDDILNNILKDISFFSFFENIYSNPDAYSELSFKQEYWKKYLAKNYPSYFQIIQNDENINWFFETIIASFSKVEYRYHNIKSLLFRKTGYIEELRYDADIKDDNFINIFLLERSFRDFSIIPLEQNFRFILDRNIQQIFKIDINTICILFTSGELVVLHMKQFNINYPPKLKIEIIMYDVKKIVLSASLYALNYKGQVYKINIYSALSKQLLPLSFDVDDINVDSGHIPAMSRINVRYNLLSLVDKEGNLYAIDAGPRANENYLINGYAVNHSFNREAIFYERDTDNEMVKIRKNVPMAQGIENNIPYYKYAMLHEGDAQHVDDPNNNDTYLLTELYFIGTNGVLYRAYYSNYELTTDMIDIPTYSISYKDSSIPDSEYKLYIRDDLTNMFFEGKKAPELIRTNVLVKDVWFIKAQLSSSITYANVCFYLDENDNIHELYSQSGISVQYKFPSHIDDNKVQQFILDQTNNQLILIFITNSRIYYHKYDHVNPKIDGIVIINIQHSQDIPFGTRIVNSKRNGSASGYIGPIVRIPIIADHVIIPYSLYLLNYLQGNVVSYKVKSNSIIFTLKNSKYVYQTTIEF